MVHVQIAAEELFAIGPIVITNSMIGALLASAVLLFAAAWFRGASSLVPNRRQAMLELLLQVADPRAGLGVNFQRPDDSPLVVRMQSVGSRGINCRKLKM